MFENFGFGEILLVMIVILIFFGPKKIPDIAQSIGKGIREFKKAMRDVQDEVTKSVSDEPKPAPKEPEKIKGPSKDQMIEHDTPSKTEAKPQ